MNNEIKVMKGASPFDDSAVVRLKHMGLLDADGRVDKANTAVLGHIMAGLFFNDICDHYSDDHAVTGVYEDLADYHSLRDYRRLLVRYSLQYDLMHQPIPPAVWWLSGVEELVRAFLDSFMLEMKVLVRLLESETDREEAPR